MDLKETPVKETFSQKELLTLMQENFLEKVCYFASCLPEQMEVRTINGITCSNAKLASDTFNIAMGGRLEESHARESIFFIAKYFDKLPMAWWFGPDSGLENYRDLLQEAGFSQNEEDVGMLMDLSTLPDTYGYPKGLEISLVQDPKKLNDFASVLASIFYPEDPCIEKYYALLHQLDLGLERPMKLFVANDATQAVAISACYFSKGIAGIYDICTRPQMQKKGFGSAMTYHALKAAKDAGYQYASLQASLDGINIYKRFGFREVCSFSVYGN